jgi:hypothetical protein
MKRKDLLNSWQLFASQQGLIPLVQILSFAAEGSGLELEECLLLWENVAKKERLASRNQIAR